MNSARLHIVRDTTSAAPNQGADTRLERGETWQAALRPQTFDDYIGQREIIGNLRISVRAAKLGHWQLDHMLFSGPPGTGKTSIATVIATELGANLRVTSAPSISHKGELASLLTSLDDGDVLFIDEIHRLAVPLQEMLYSAMEDAKVDLFTPAKKAITVKLPKFTLLGATTHAGLLTGPLLDRFGFHWQLRHYSLADMEAIVERAAPLVGVAIDADGASEIARRSRGTPRIANRLVRRVRDFAMVAASEGALVPMRNGRRSAPNTVTVNGPLAAVALDHLMIDHAGLDPVDRAYLTALADRGTPTGVESLAATLNEQRETLEDNVEPYLLQLGMIARSPRGRVITDAGRQHLHGS